MSSYEEQNQHPMLYVAMIFDFMNKEIIIPEKQLAIIPRGHGIEFHCSHRLTEFHMAFHINLIELERRPPLDFFYHRFIKEINEKWKRKHERPVTMRKEFLYSESSPFNNREFFQQEILRQFSVPKSILENKKPELKPIQEKYFEDTSKDLVRKD